MPLLADVPLLGKLFRSRSLKKQNTELLVLVTPERVRPIPAGQKPPSVEMQVPLTYGPDRAPRTPGMEVTGPVPSKQPEPMPMESLQKSIDTGNSITLSAPQSGTRDTALQRQKDVTAPAATAPPPAAAPPPQK
jgi:pilus assembly protein CpaC